MVAVFGCEWNALGTRHIDGDEMLRWPAPGVNQRPTSRQCGNRMRSLTEYSPVVGATTVHNTNGLASDPPAASVEGDGHDRPGCAHINNSTIDDSDWVSGQQRRRHEVAVSERANRYKVVIGET